MTVMFSSKEIAIFNVTMENFIILGLIASLLFFFFYFTYSGGLTWYYWIEALGFILFSLRKALADNFKVECIE